MASWVRDKLGIKDNTRMQQLDLSKDAEKYLDENQKFFVKKIEKANKVRVVQTKTTKKRGRYIGLALLFSAVGLYIGTLRSIKQETFLDEFDDMHKSS